MFVLERLTAVINSALEDYPRLDRDVLLRKVANYVSVHEDITYTEASEQAVLYALDEMGYEDGRPDWTYVASRIFLASLYDQAGKQRGYESTQFKYGSFYNLVVKLTKLGIYNPRILESYSIEEIREVGIAIDPSLDNGFTYIGIRHLADRYIAKGFDKEIYELPQERFAIIAMLLMIDEPKKKRMELVKEAYWAMSNRFMTVATPTLTNAGKNWGQLSSCFIDTVDDNLQSIFDSNTDVANLSKGGGGIGVYLGKLRTKGGAIKGFKGASSGVLPWMKQYNNTAVSVDQLGQRKGAIAVYLDVWSKDIFPFLDAKLNNGDERFRTHDLFTGVCIPDIFMETVQRKGEWYLFDPHEVRQVMGYSLEDSYDEVRGDGTFRQRYAECVANKELSRTVVKAIDIMKRIMVSQLETGTPYMFYRDEVNRKNPNPHKGMIYCSNLCSEIAQNQSPTPLLSKEFKDGLIVSKHLPGDFVVCNLSSINLGQVWKAAGGDLDTFFTILRRLIRIQVRMLDNVIDLNNLPVVQAQVTNMLYRAIGLGTFGWHHLLALMKIKWNSDEAVELADKLYEHIAFCTIEASALLAEEKGAYPYFEGSDWHTGAYFTKRGYTSAKWKGLAQIVAKVGIRNAYLMAVAPNMSTSLIGGSTASIDPVFKRMYSEEKKDYKIPVTAPDLNPATNWFYTSAYHVDQIQSIKQNAARTRHIDQAISFNLYVTNETRAPEILKMHMTAWELGLKTTYYVRSTSQEVVDDCDFCHS